ncbi:MAG: hypothetical protein HYT03_02520 [Candidatus Harrisonbacteria bacterium]|nr:hypothetical protein [Candidatus Harrisonbacteria bacterium]
MRRFVNAVKVVYLTAALISCLVIGLQILFFVGITILSEFGIVSNGEIDTLFGFELLKHFQKIGMVSAIIISPLCVYIGARLGKKAAESISHTKT